ncbi:hypothetical protein MANES_03G070776v8 [Manihot esculenta]|uniref:Uncharacterized protein n=1 Tax=Manihot esculenta TaxID=3983 RepID=A0ACB7HXH0_MANES|nr:hypothetical protein MANES_03G070776v8 [Manihot esculenta]
MSEINANSSSSSSSATGFGSSFPPVSFIVTDSVPSIPKASQFLCVKLTSPNYLLWHAQLIPLLYHSNLANHVSSSAASPNPTLADGSPNPSYVTWFRRDQLLRKQLKHLSKASDSIDSYMRRTKHIFDQLSALQFPKSSSLSYDDLYALLLSEESQRTTEKEFLPHSVQPSAHAALKISTGTTHHNISKSARGGRNGGRGRANYHGTTDSGNISNPSSCHGSESIPIGNGTHLPITQIGSSTMSTSVSSFTSHNHQFVIKDILTRQALHQSPSNGGLYQLPLSLSASPHARLGHANFKIVTVNNNRLSFGRGKSHNLPSYAYDTRVIKPLQPICSDVWAHLLYFQFETHGDLFNFTSIPFKYSPFAFETTVDIIN